ncbi:MAG: hypothetical protein L0H79_21265 [Intrasporangium sp.]|uniref:DUF6884 domain-containing protein n=1 Tax=Intrasporangium sp. TaxID=1925024 RepID=UPI00264A2519|nr:DUF6884 domain-containing protein [Intrasporangium sp.]MDN5798258.1 hypothetical protein [Intrasporangium sp.]
MAAHWRALHDYLVQQDRRVTLSWERLDEIVGGVPASATNHRAWWSGDRPHVRVWRTAGFHVEDLRPGHSVTFVRDHAPDQVPARPTRVRPQSHAPTRAGDADVILVTCVKTKRPSPSAAKDLYVSPLFLKERAYAEASGRPWFILSAEHGLVAPDEWLAPYERYLPDTPREYRDVWGRWVAARLLLLVGSLKGKIVEVHASEEYIRAIAEPLLAAGAVLVTPLAGLSLGQRQQWYAAHPLPSQPAVPDVAEPETTTTNEDLVGPFVDFLGDANHAMSIPDLLATERVRLQRPGLYSWWIDEEGSAQLGHALGYPLDPGLIYVGQAGASRMLSGRRSSNTLWSRIAGMHLGRKQEFSTFRRTLAALLFPSDSEGAIDEDALTEWMSRHLQVVTVPVANPDTLGQLEHDVLQRLDPPLNLQGMPPSTVRERLSQLRKRFSS